MSIKIMQPNQRITIQDKGFLKGDDGGYYIPYINEEGFLSWTPSEEGMEEVQGANVKGRDSVYIGAEEPEDDDVLIWINPDGTPAPETIPTVETVNQLIEESVLPEEKVIELIEENSLSEERVIELIEENTVVYPIAEEVLW